MNHTSIISDNLARKDGHIGLMEEKGCFVMFRDWRPPLSTSTNRTLVEYYNYPACEFSAPIVRTEANPDFDVICPAGIVYPDPCRDLLTIISLTHFR